MRWHIERDYQELKNELGLNHYEGRNWLGFHHHATPYIGAYSYLVVQRIEESSGPKNSTKRKQPTVPNNFIALESPQTKATC